MILPKLMINLMNRVFILSHPIGKLFRGMRRFLLIKFNRRFINMERMPKWILIENLIIVILDDWLVVHRSRLLLWLRLQINLLFNEIFYRFLRLKKLTLLIIF